MAFNLSRNDVVPFTEKAVSLGIRRILVTVQLPIHQINDTNLPEFDSAISLCKSKGSLFTGIRHCKIVEGNEDSPYEIVNSSVYLLSDQIEQGVLARVAAELFINPKSFQQECGVCSSSAFAQAYLNILRSTGLSRAQEVEKIFEGGIQRVARLVVNRYKADETRAEELATKREARRRDIEKENEEMRRNFSRSFIDPSYGVGDGVGGADAQPSEVQFLGKRADEILSTVWAELDARLATRTTSKTEFFEMNRENAFQLAKRELEDVKVSKRQRIMELRSEQEFFEKHVDASRRQYAKLLNMERKEILLQKELSDIWIKYVYLLLESTMRSCASENQLFYNLDLFGQTMLLREKADELRKQCNIPPYEVIYDPLDAEVIVQAMMKDPIALEIGLNKPAEVLVKTLEEKYGKLLKSVPVSGQVFTHAVLNDFIVSTFPFCFDFVRRCVGLNKSSSSRLKFCKKSFHLRPPPWPS
jgi:hypothetical protein